MIRFTEESTAQVAFNPRGQVEAVTTDGRKIIVVTTDETGKTSWTWTLHESEDLHRVRDALLNLLEMTT
jgi:hypothetical protein